MAVLLVAGIAILAFVATEKWTPGAWLRMSESRSDPAADAAASDGTDASRPRLTGRTEPGSVAPFSPSIAPPPVDLAAVDRERDLHGVVVDVLGKPVAGADLGVVTYPWRRGSILANERYDEAVEGPSTRSATDGTFRLPLRPGTVVSLRVRAEGYAPVGFGGLQPGARIRVVLRRGVALVVHAVGPDERALPGVEVEVHAAWSEPVGFEAHATTDARGTCRLDDLPAGIAVVLEAQDGPRGGFSSEYDSIRLPTSGALEHRVVIAPGWVVTGRVTDAETGRPVANAVVGMGWTLFKPTKTDADGRYALGGWVANDYHEIDVAAPGYARSEEVVGERKAIDFALERGFALTGRVRTDDGHPVAGAVVATIGSKTVNGRQLSAHAEGRSDETGRFGLADLARDLPYVLVVMPEGRGRTLLDVAAPPTGVPVVDVGTIVVPAAHTISGRVLDDEGRPLADVRVTLSGGNDDVARLLPPEVPAFTFDGYYGQEEERTTDDLGRFAFTDLAPGTYILTAEREGESKTTRTVVLAAGGDARDIELAFEPDRPFRVSVVGPDGKGVAHVLVDIAPQDFDEQMEWTAADGVVTFHLPLGAETVKVQVLDVPEGAYLCPDPEEVSADVGKHRVHLRAADLVHGVLVGPDRAGVVRASIEARRAGEAVGYAQTDGAGAFLLAAEPGGPVDLAFFGDVYRSDPAGRYRAVRLPLEASLCGVLLDGGTVRLEAAPVAADLTLLVRVEDPSGAPLAGATVSVRPVPDGHPDPVAADPGGVARIDGLTARPVALTVRPPADRSIDLASANRDDLTAGPDPVVVRLAPPRLLLGRVLDEEGHAVAGAEVTTWAAGEDLHAQTDAEGRFTLRMSPDVQGEIRVRAVLGAGAGSMLRYGEVSGVRPASGPVRIVLRPRAR